MGVGGNAWLIFSPSQPQSDVYWESWCSRSLPDGLQMCLHLGRPSQETDAPAHSSHPGWISPPAPRFFPPAQKLQTLLSSPEVGIGQRGGEKGWKVMGVGKDEQLK